MVLFDVCREPFLQELHGSSSHLCLLLLYKRDGVQSLCVWNPMRSSWLTGGYLGAVDGFSELET